MSRVAFTQGLVTQVIGRVPISANGPTLLFLQVPYVEGIREVVRGTVETLGRADHHLRSFVDSGERKAFIDDPLMHAYALACFRETTEQRSKEPGTGELTPELAGRARRVMVDHIIELLQERDDELERRGGSVIYLAVLRRKTQLALCNAVRDSALRDEGYVAYEPRTEDIGSNLVVEVRKFVHFSGDGFE